MSSISLKSQAFEILLERDVDSTITRTRELATMWKEGQLPLGEHPVVKIFSCGRPAKPELVSPKNLGKRNMTTKEGKAVLFHALAHIEFNAVHLALDAVYRFSDMPNDYYDDWMKVADDEAKHFQMLNAQMKTLGFAYGDFPAHNGLWQMALDTDDDVMVRMALVPRLLEARGLDVAPKIGTKLRRAGDHAAGDVVDIIIKDEITHVKIGNRWFHWCCKQRNLDPMTVFKESLEAKAKDILRGPLAHDLRLEAGFTQEELDWLEETLLKKA